MRYEDRLYYFDDLIGGGNTCSGIHTIAPSEEETAVAQHNAENAIRDDMEDIEKGVISGLDSAYSDKSVPLSTFLDEFSKDIRTGKKRFPFSEETREIIESYKKNKEMSEKVGKVFNDAYDFWVKRETKIERNHSKTAKEKNMTLAEYRRELQSREAESPRVVAQIKEDIKAERAAEKAAAAAEKAAAAAAIVEATVNLARRGKRGARR